MSASLEQLRGQIDAVDKQLCELLNRRGELAMEIGKLKQASQLPARDQEREREILRNVEKLNAGGVLSNQSMQAIFGEIVEACRNLQQQLKVGYLGPVGTFSHVASVSHFGKHALLRPYDNLAKAFKDASEGQLDYILAPLENSSEGVVGQTLDLLSMFELNVLHQFSVPIRHSLMGRGNTHITRVVSHHQALAQSRGWLSLNLPGVELASAASSGAAAIMAQTDDTLAVVGPKQLAKVYGLHVLAENIEDNPHNQTLFVVVGRGLNPKSGSDRTMLWFAAPHHSGSLYECLKPLADYNINLTRLHSRPSPKGPWQYKFYLEMEGHFSDENVSQGIASLKEHSEQCMLIGSYSFSPLPVAGS